MLKFGQSSVQKIKSPIFVNTRCFADKIRAWKDWKYKIHEITDDLYRDSKYDVHHGGMDEVINHIKNDPTMQISSRNLGFQLYNLAKENKDHETLRSVISTQFMRLSGRMLPRHAFGAFYGALVLNYPSIVVNFCEEQFLDHEKEHIMFGEVIEIMEALSVNTSVSRSSHHALIAGHLEPYINQKFKSKYKYRFEELLTLIKSLDRLEYYHTDLLYRCIQSYCKLEIYRIERFHDGLSHLYDIKNRGVCTVDFTEDLEYLKAKHHNKIYFKKVYDFEEARYFNYEELKATRNEDLGHQTHFIAPNWAQDKEMLELAAEKYRAEYTEEGREAARMKLDLDDLVSLVFVIKNNIG